MNIVKSDYSRELLGTAFIIGIFYSSITLNIIPGETSPLAGVTGLILILKYGYDEYHKFLICILFLMLSCFACIAFEHNNYIEIIKQFFAYSQILIVFIACKYIDISSKLNLIYTLIGINLFVDIVQITGFGAEILDPLLSILVSRGAAVYSIESGRGIAGLTSEPSHLAMSAFVHSFLLTLSGHFARKDLSIWALIYVLFIVILSASGTGVALFLIFVTPFLFKRVISTFFIFLILMLALFFLKLPDRLIEILNVLNQFDSDAFTSIFYISGFRFPSVIAAYAHSLTNISLGGAGSWFTRILEGYDLIGVDIRTLGHFVEGGFWTPTKPTSLFATISLEFGFLGFLGSAIFFIFLLFKSFDIEPKFTPYFIVSLFGAYALSTVGNPGFPFILGLVIYGRLNVKA